MGDVFVVLYACSGSLELSLGRSRWRCQGARATVISHTSQNFCAAASHLTFPY